MKKHIIVIVCLLVFLALCATFLQVVTYGCFWWECSPRRPFKVLDLDLPTDLFPSGANINALYPISEGGGTLENGRKSIYWGYQGAGIANYEVLRFSSTKKAAEVFSSDKAIFVDRITLEPWERPSILTFTSTLASEFFVGCGNWSDFRCGMTGRYEEYVITFNAVIDTEMTYNDFEEIVMFIDRQITARLFP